MVSSFLLCYAREKCLFVDAMRHAFSFHVLFFLFFYPVFLFLFFFLPTIINVFHPAKKA